MLYTHLYLKESEHIMPEENNLHLADLIQSVKQGLIDSSKQSLEDQEQDGTPILLELDEVELELKFYVSTSGKGKANIFVSSVEGSVESAKTQTARIKLKVHKGGENGNDGVYHHIARHQEGQVNLGVNHVIAPDTK